ncbi:hypothetical protein POM88_027202 [Heracleum sosnowskyi]|uniref:Auxin-responsive protein n=1 Tax=Heracleum sosnowskyi TaxID=360622 RepID=A0AAD8I9N4_9APIA|nr:hypothetical protein POM88_027202 [Heracleum sosnowskyi]
MNKIYRISASTITTQTTSSNYLLGVSVPKDLSPQIPFAPGASQAVISYEKLQQLQEDVCNDKAEKNERSTMTPWLHNILNEGIEEGSKMVLPFEPLTLTFESVWYYVETPTSTRGKEMLSESKLRDLLHGSEYVVTYEDKDGDWMLVGDVPWDISYWPGT